jgi:hypothetical protein
MRWDKKRNFGQMILESLNLLQVIAHEVMGLYSGVQIAASKILGKDEDLLFNFQLRQGHSLSSDQWLARTQPLLSISVFRLNIVFD